ncbi:MAG: hypothetical protein ACOXZR_00145 [Bacilli bacterium]|jgi:hypothetical protein
MFFDQRPFSSGDMMSQGTPLTEDMHRCCPPTPMGSSANQVVEPTMERCVTRNVCHNVRHL